MTRMIPPSVHSIYAPLLWQSLTATASSVYTDYKTETKTITVPVLTTKTETNVITKETKVPTTKYKTETKTVCTTKKGGY